MKKAYNFLLLIGLCLSVVYSCRTEGFSTVSRRMDDCSGVPRHRFGYHDVRMMLYDSSRFKSMLQRNDTLYLLHNISVESGQIRMLIWSLHDTLSYSCLSGHVEKENDILFPESYMLFVGKWDTAAIRKYAASTHLMHSETNFAYRLIPHGKTHRVECIRFTDFIVPEIDLIHRVKERHLH